MPTGCFICNSGTSRLIPGLLAGYVLGSCQKCSILACSGHAQRDPNHPRWICVLCDPTLLTAAGIAASRSVFDGSVLTSLISPALVQEGANYPSVEVFIQRRPAYIQIRLMERLAYVLELAPQRFSSMETEKFWFGLSDQGKRLVGAAIVLVQSLEISEDSLLEALRVLIHTWRSSKQ